MQLHVLQTEKFSCHSCGNCCRDWHVELLPGEADRIKTLDWPQEDPLRKAKVLLDFQGRTMLAHRANGACIFLDEDRNLCRIHEQFGAMTKPLGCRLYPFHIVPTFDNEASVTARFDCPSVRQNKGAPHSAELANLTTFAQTITSPEGFNDVTRCLLEREQIEMVCEFTGMLLGAFERDDQRALFIYVLCDWLTTTKVCDLDRERLGSVFAELKEKVETLIASPTAAPGLFERLAFRTLLSLYLRRDEDVVNGRAGRIGRSLAMMKLILGFGGFKSLGLSHRPGKLRAAKLFKPGGPEPDPVAFALHWRMIRTKLNSFQFMGKGNHGRDFLSGLRSLALLYPLVMAVAKYSAANRGATRIETDDVDYAVAAIEHSFGRLAILNQPMTQNLERMLMLREMFVRVVMNV